MMVLKREAVSLHPDTVEAIREAILAERPDYGPRVAGLTFQKSVQPFFSKHTIVYANSAVPMPARFVVLALGPAGKGAPLLLTKHIERLRAVAASDPPPDLGLQDTAQGYALTDRGRGAFERLELVVAAQRTQVAEGITADQYGQAVAVLERMARNLGYAGSTNPASATLARA